MFSNLGTDQMGEYQCTGNPRTVRLRNLYCLRYNTNTEGDPKDPSIKKSVLSEIVLCGISSLQINYGNYFCYINYLEWLYNIKKT